MEPDRVEGRRNKGDWGSSCTRSILSGRIAARLGGEMRVAAFAAVQAKRAALPRSQRLWLRAVMGIRGRCSAREC